MKIAIIGYGKMGHAVERAAIERGHDIVAVIDRDNTADFDSEAFRSADVAIEFTTPSTAPANIMEAVSRGVPVVCGSTGWNDRREEIDRFVAEKEGALVASSNFSIGVNILFDLNERLAAVMNRLPHYRPSLSETHHIHKLDHPSGTAITLIKGITDNCDRIEGWEETNAPVTDDRIIPVTCERRGEVPGIHSVTWDSPVDAITISHDAHSREGFALGAVMAAEWLPMRKGIFSFPEVLRNLEIL